MIYDISPPLSAATPVWPGDAPLSRHLNQVVEQGDTATTSRLSATVHLGAHVDAPCHYQANGAGVGTLSLAPFIGPCEIIDVNVARGSTIPSSALPRTIQAPRVLLRTGTGVRNGLFPTDFAALSLTLIEELSSRGCLLIGIDTPSVDLYDSRNLLAHHACGHANIAILEGLVLNHVPAGVYELIALPLRLIDFDASPVRAILRTLDHD